MNELNKLRAARDRQMLDDARKLAAFDDLLAALKKCETVMRQMQDTPAEAQNIIRQGYYGHALETARATIAKATGQG